MGRFATITLLVSMLVTPGFPEIHPAVEGVKKSIESQTPPARDRPMMSKKDFDQHLNFYENPSSKASLIADYFFCLDDTIKNRYFDLFVTMCDETVKKSPTQAFIDMCVFIELNNSYITDSQLEKALSRVITYGTRAMNSLPQGFVEWRQSYKEGLDTLRMMYKRLTKERKEIKRTETR